MRTELEAAQEAIRELKRRNLLQEHWFVDGNIEDVLLKEFEEYRLELLDLWTDNLLRVARGRNLPDHR